MWGCIFQKCYSLEEIVQVINKNASAPLASSEILILVLLALVFAAINVVYSTHYGRLAIPPTYDDIGFISNGLVLLDTGYQHGWGQWLLNLFTKTWHAPVTVLQACLAFAVFGKTAWAPYLLNGLYLIVLLICLRKEFFSVSLLTFLAVTISILAWPLTGYLIVEFRPDIPTNLILALGTWRLAKRHEEIGQGQYRRLQPIWEISWPFLAALWLKPSFSPVVVGLWLSSWTLLCGVNHFILKREWGFRHTLTSFVRSTLLLFIFFLPYLVVSGSHLAQYFVANIFSKSQDIWSPPLSMTDNLKYYVIGDGGWVTMKWWSVVTVAVALFAFLVAMRSRDYKALKLGWIYASFAFVAWIGMTILKNKSPWFGSLVSSHFLGIFVLASWYIIENLRKVSLGHHLYTAFLVLSGVVLHTWPNSSGVIPGLNLAEIPAYSREAKRVFADTCNAIVNHSGGNKVSILMPVISLMVNPDLIELCSIEGDAVPTDAPRIYMQPYDQMLATIQSNTESGESNMLAIVLSTDFPSIPGNMPTAKHMGSVNHLFSSSTRFRLVSVIQGPNGTGSIRLFKKIAAFSPIENVTGMKDFEGPYPETNLPIVRWTLFPASEFDLHVSPGHRTRLALAGLPALPRMAANVRLSTGGEKSCEFRVGIFTECYIDFSPQNDLVHVKIEPYRIEQIASMPATGEAILLSQIAVVDMEKPVVKDALRSESPFSGIDFLEGFGDIEGPYKKWDLPVVIWGRGDFSRIGIVSTSNEIRTLLIEWRPGEALQAVDVLYRDISIGRCLAGEPGNTFRRCEITLPLEMTSSDLTLRYVGDKRILSKKMNNSALFRRIQLVVEND